MWIKRSKMKLKNKCGKISKKFRNIKKQKKKKKRILKMISLLI